MSAGALVATADLPLTSALSSLVLMPGMVNVVNFMDGINGITSTTMTVWGLSTCEAALRRADVPLGTLGAVTTGVAVGFLPWNAPRAKLFLGDSGSYLFGGLVATGLVAATRSPYGHHRTSDWQTALPVASPLLLYVLDAAQALAKRAAAGAKLTEAHRDHIYQRLVDESKLSHMQVSALHAGLATGLAASARLPRRAFVSALAIVSCTYLALPSLLATSPSAKQEPKDKS